VDRLLLTASNLSVEDVFSHVAALGGVVIPAHVDRDSYSIISNLGIIPENPEIKYLEISKFCDKTKYLEKNPILEDLILSDLLMPIHWATFWKGKFY